jgi:hypothetical protein
MIDKAVGFSNIKKQFCSKMANARKYEPPLTGRFELHYQRYQATGGVLKDPGMCFAEPQSGRR